MKTPIGSAATITGVPSGGEERSAIAPDPQPRTGMAGLNTGDANKNRLLARLSAPELEQLRPYLEAVELTAGQILHEAGHKQQYAYFPASGIVVPIQLTEDGRTTKIAMTGHDGLAGIIHRVQLEQRACKCPVPRQITGTQARRTGLGIRLNEWCGGGPAHRLIQVF